MMIRQPGIGIILGIALLAGVLHAQVLLDPNQAKTEITLPGDPFLENFYTDGQELSWGKFTVLKAPHDANTVYFQNSRTLLLHWDFATEYLAPFEGLNPLEFDQITLYEPDQQGVLGAVLTSTSVGPDRRITEYGIQLVRHDPYSREETLHWLQVVRDAVQVDPNVQPFYFPTYEQQVVSETHGDWFAEQGFPVGSAAMWTQEDVIYAPGWAMGRLQYVPTDEIESAYTSGDLLPTDILMTDSIPSEVPHVAGIISLAPATPSSHVAILSQTLNIPFVYLASEDAQENARAMAGYRIALRAIRDVGVMDARPLTDLQVETLLDLKAPVTLDIMPIQRTGVYALSTDQLTPEDIDRVGGKAANFGMLRRAIPKNSPPAIALTFDLWIEFLDQAFAGHTLREAIAEKLALHRPSPVSMAALQKDLSDIRDWFKDDNLTTFTPEQKSGILDALTDRTAGFDLQRKIRFRSSTNVEDSDVFSGAGLYDSFSGCLADDLDDDTAGPSHCDPNRSNERGVFRAIRRVFASFYNQNAFLERLRHDINEDKVGMAILVHHSFPDEIEWANGVAVYNNRSQYSKWIDLVTQPGAVSVTNAEPGLIPEEVEVYVSSFGGNLYPSVRAYSSLMPLGQTVMTWEEDYQALSRLCLAAVEEYERVTGKSEYRLEFEYKWIAPDGDLVIKQIREIPSPKTSATETGFLVAEPLTLQTFQGEHADVFANHRLKSQWTLEAQSGWLDTERLANSLFSHIGLTYQAEGVVRELSGQPGDLPEFQHSVTLPGDYRRFETRDRWVLPDLGNPRDMVLSATLRGNASLQAGCPLVTLRDLDFTVDVTHAGPVAGWAYQNGEFVIVDRYEDSVRLVEPKRDSSQDIPQHRHVEQDGIEVDISFVWPPHPTGPTAGYTAPLQRWQQTVITGLTSEPIVLTGDYSQTYRPEHHNFFEHFLFELRLEPDVPASILEELETQGIQQIHVFTGPFGAQGQGIFLYPGKTSEPPGGR